MKKDTFNTLNIVTTAMLSAFAVVLSATLHHFASRQIAIMLSPMHFPVLLMGILCGPWLGLIGGLLAPVMSYLTSGSPAPDTLVPMIFELSMYGFLTGLLRWVFLKNSKTSRFASIFALILAMVAGRILNALVKGVFLASAGTYTYFMGVWVTFLNNFKSTYGGIILQIVLIPLILFALQKSGILLKYLPDSPTVKKAVASAVAEKTTEGETEDGQS